MPTPSPGTPKRITAARSILLAGSRPRVTRTATLAAGIGTPDADPQSIPGLVAGYCDLDEGRAPPAGFLAKMLASPSVVSLTVDAFPRVLRYVAHEFIATEGITAALSSLNRNGLDAGIVDKICEAVGQTLITDHVPAARWDMVLSRLSLLAPNACPSGQTALIEQATSEPDALAGASGHLRLALLREAATAAFSPAHPAIGYLLRTAGPDWQTVVMDPALPGPWRATALATALAGPAGPSPAALAEFLRRAPEMARRTLRATPRPGTAKGRYARATGPRPGPVYRQHRACPAPDHG